MAAAAVTWEAVPGGGGGAGAGGGTPSSEYKHREGDEAHARLWRAGGARRDGVKRHAAPPRAGKPRPRGSRPCRCGRGAGSSLPPWRGRGRGEPPSPARGVSPAARLPPAALSMQGAPAIPEEVCSLLAGKAGRRQGGKAGEREGFPGGGRAVSRAEGRPRGAGRWGVWGAGVAGAAGAWGGGSPSSRSPGGALLSGRRTLPPASWVRGFPPRGSPSSPVTSSPCAPAAAAALRRVAAVPFPAAARRARNGEGERSGSRSRPGRRAVVLRRRARSPPVRLWVGARCAGPPQSCAGGVEVLCWQACVEGSGRQSGPVALLLTGALAAGGSFSLSRCVSGPAGTVGS